MAVLSVAVDLCQTMQIEEGSRTAHANKCPVLGLALACFGFG